MKFPGEKILFDLPAEKYHAVSAYSNSWGNICDKQTALDAHEAWLYPPPSTPASDEGTGTHLACLEPEDYSARVVGPLMKDGERVDRRSNEHKALWAQYEAENDGKLILPLDAMARIERMAHAIDQHPITHALLCHPKRKIEVSVFWLCRTLGIPCKARIDCLTMDGEYAVALDLKTIEGYRPPTPFAPASGGLSMANLKRVAGGRGYDMQAWHYLDGLNTLSSIARQFYFAFVSKPPKTRPQMSPKVRVVAANSVMEYEGEHKTMQARRAYAAGMESGEWAGWESKVELLGLNTWDQVADREMDDAEE